MKKTITTKVITNNITQKKMTRAKVITNNTTQKKMTRANTIMNNITTRKKTNNNLLGEKKVHHDDDDLDVTIITTNITMISTIANH
jgi:hypothetical protein